MEEGQEISLRKKWQDFGTADMQREGMEMSNNPTLSGMTVSTAVEK